MIFWTVLFAGLFLITSTGWAFSEWQRKTVTIPTVQPDPDDTTQPKPSRYKDQVTPQDYHTIFEATQIGQAILSDLVGRFGGTSYVRGGHDADRETCFRAGQKHVVDHILIQTNRAVQIQQKQPEVETDD